LRYQSNYNGYGLDCQDLAYGIPSSSQKTSNGKTLADFGEAGQQFRPKSDSAHSLIGA
jgi:hypothetical protein